MHLKQFYIVLGNVLKNIGENERLIVCGDLNGHVDAATDGFEGVHGGKGYGIRNTEEEMLLEFSDAMGLTVCNAWFRKRDQHKVTYESGGCKTQVDYILIRQRDRKWVSNIRIIQSETCIPNHKLVICDI